MHQTRSPVFWQHVGLDNSCIYIYDGEKATTTTLRRRKHRTALELFGTCGIDIDDSMHDIYIYLQYQLMQRKESYQTFLEQFCTHQLFVLDPVTSFSPRSDFQKKEFLANSMGKLPVDFKPWPPENASDSSLAAPLSFPNITGVSWWNPIIEWSFFKQKILSPCHQNFFCSLPFAVHQTEMEGTVPFKGATLNTVWNCQPLVSLGVGKHRWYLWHQCPPIVGGQFPQGFKDS